MALRGVRSFNFYIRSYHWLQSAARELICTESAYSQTDDAPYAAENKCRARSSRCQFVYPHRSQHTRSATVREISDQLRN
jgi:hypothetical protein